MDFKWSSQCVWWRDQDNVSWAGTMQEFSLNSSHMFLNQMCFCFFRYKVLEVAADVLIKEEVLSGNAELSNQVVVHLLPFMVIDSDDVESAEMKIAIYLSKSGICSLHPVLRGWKEGKKFTCFLEKWAGNTLKRRQVYLTIGYTYLNHVCHVTYQQDFKNFS